MSRTTLALLAALCASSPSDAAPTQEIPPWLAPGNVQAQRLCKTRGQKCKIMADGDFFVRGAIGNNCCIDEQSIIGTFWSEDPLYCLTDPKDNKKRCYGLDKKHRCKNSMINESQPTLDSTCPSNKCGIGPSCPDTPGVRNSRGCSCLSLA